MNTLSTRTLGILGILSGFAAFFLLVSPYYYFLGRTAYIPKTNPDFGYFLPKSLEAWFFLALALSLLTFSFVALVMFIKRKKAEKTF